MDQDNTIKTLPLAFGAHKSPSDEREFTASAVASSIEHPTSCFTSTSWMTASMQSKQPCCVGCTEEEAARQDQYVAIGIMANPGTEDELSWRFLYAVAKCLEGTPGYEQYAPVAEGTYPALVAAIRRKYGIPLSKFCPNDTTLSAEDFIYGRDISRIPHEVFADASTRKGGATITFPTTIDGVKAAIIYAAANKGTVRILRSIGDTYWKGPDGITTWDASKLIPIRIPELFTSGHEETLEGYDTDPINGRLRLHWLNHWSERWADNGRAWEYADEWIAHVVELRVSVPKLTPQDGFRFDFTRALSRGMDGADVLALQHILAIEGVWEDGVKWSSHFGPKTEAAVEALQTKHRGDILDPAGLKLPTGRVGQFTLAWLKKNYGTS